MPTNEKQNDDLRYSYLTNDSLNNACRVRLTYDTVLSHIFYKQIAKDIIKKINKADKRSKKYGVRIDLSIKNGMYQLDSFFKKLLTEIKKSCDVPINVIANFGKYRIGKNDVRYLFDGSELKELARLRTTLHALGDGSLLFSETQDGNYWTLTQVLEANSCIQGLAQTVKENDLSPFEALLFVCTWAQKNLDRNYDTEKADETTNTIIAAVENKKILCVGFSQFVMAVVQSLEKEWVEGNRLGIETIPVAFDKNEEHDIYVSKHAQSKCYLVDKKYNINGEVIADVHGFRNGLWLTATDNGTILTVRPISIFSEIASNHNLYKIYTQRNMEKSKRKRISSLKLDLIDNKTQTQILMQTKINAMLAKTLESHDIHNETFDEAYEKIIPLVFPEAKPGDLIAPIPEFIDAETRKCGWYGHLEISRDDNKNFWIDVLEKLVVNEQTKTSIGNDPNLSK